MASTRPLPPSARTPAPSGPWALACGLASCCRRLGGGWRLRWLERTAALLRAWAAPWLQEARLAVVAASPAVVLGRRPWARTLIWVVAMRLRDHPVRGGRRGLAG